jgi:hypothetical protein
VLIFVAVLLVLTLTQIPQIVCASTDDSQGEREVDVTITMPSNMTYALKRVMVHFNWSSYENEHGVPKWIGYSLDDQTLVTVGNTSTASDYGTYLENVADGVHLFKVIVYGSILPNYSVETQFTVDTTHPTVMILSPQNTTYQNGVPLEFKVNEPTDLISYIIDSNDVIINPENNTILDLPAGPHSISVSASDIAGLTGTSEQVFFTVVQQQDGSQTGLPTEYYVAIILTATIALVTVAYLLIKNRHTKK